VATITSADVVALAPELATVDSGRMAWAVAEANTRLTASFWTSGEMDPSRQTMGRALYAAHLLSAKLTGAVVSETVGPLTRTYARKASTEDFDELDSTMYGRRYRRLIRFHPGRVGQVY
jgi:Protein of unknown function (DUF4054)